MNGRKDRKRGISANIQLNLFDYHPKPKTDADYQREYGWFDGEFSGVKSDERRRKFGEVYTPRWLAERMIDEIPGSCSIESTVFEPCCGEGAFITCILRRKLALARSYKDKLRACQTCYGLDIQPDNVEICRAKMTAIAVNAGVNPDDAARVFVRNIIHGDMLFFPMIARFFDWKTNTYTTLEEMASE